MTYLGSSPTSQNFISGTDYFNGTGSQTAFTLTRSVNSVNDIEVVVNNVIQQPNSYTVSGSTLTLSAAPSSGTSNVYVRYLSTTNISVNLPQDPSIRGNLNLATTSARITGDFSNSTSSNRVLFQTSTTNGNTGIGAIPNGTSTTTNLIAYNNSDPNNSGRMRMQMSSTDASITADYTGTGSYLPITFWTSATERMRIDSGGNLLLGITSGTSKLMVSNGSAYTHINFGNTAVNGATPWLATWNNATGSSADYGWAWYDSSSDGSLNLYRRNASTTGNQVLNIARASGDVSISNGGGKNAGLAVTGLAKPAYWGETTTSVDMIYLLANTGGSSGTAVYVMPCRFGSTQTFGGGVYWTGSVMQYTGTSDARLKENIVDSESGLEKLANVKIRSFDWKESGAHVDFGVIAQELEEVAPEAVAKGKDNEDGTIDTPYAVDTSVLVPAMIKAIQEQQVMIEELKNKVAALEAK